MKRVGIPIVACVVFHGAVAAAADSSCAEKTYRGEDLVAQGDTADAYLSPTGFILTRSVLITIRFAPLSTFDVVAEQVRKDETLRSAADVFTTLLEAMVDRGADVLERLAGETGKVSKSVFRGDPSRSKQIVRSNNALRRG